MPKFCAFCGKPLKNRHQTYCSDKCKYLNSGRRKGLPERKCTQCGQIFYAKDKRFTLCLDCRKARKYYQLCGVMETKMRNDNAAIKAKQEADAIFENVTEDGKTKEGKKEKVKSRYR